MKKKILSLLLVLVMILSLCMVSCDDEEEPPAPPPPPPPIPVETIKYKPTISSNDSTQTTVNNTFEVTDDMTRTTYYSFGSYINTQVDLYRKSTESTDYDAKVYTYTLFSHASGLTYTFDVMSKNIYDAKIPEDAITSYQVRRDYASRYWAGLLLTLHHEDGTYTHILFDSYLNQIDKIEDSDDYSPYFYVDYTSRWTGNTYEYFAYVYLDENTYEVFNYYQSSNGDYQIVKLSDSDDDDDRPAFETSSIVKDDATGEYYYVTSSKFARFTAEGKLIFSYALDDIPADSSPSAKILNSGDVLVVFNQNVALDAEDYDYYTASGSITRKSKTKSMLFSRTSQTLTELEDLIYFSDTIYTSASEKIKELGLTEGVNFMIEPKYITEGKAFQRLENTIVAFDDAMKVVKFYKFPALEGEFTTYDNGAIVYSNGYETYLVNENGEKIADIPRSSTRQSNNKWFIDDGCVYNNKYELLYDFAKDGRTVYGVYDNAILFAGKTPDAETGELVESLISWSGVASEKVICPINSDTHNQIRITDSGYIFFLEEQAESNYDKLTLMKADGSVVKTWENVSYRSITTTYGHSDDGITCEIEISTDIYEDETYIRTDEKTVFFVIYTRPNNILGE